MEKTIELGDKITIFAQGKYLEGQVIYKDFWKHWKIRVMNKEGIHKWDQKIDGGEITKIDKGEI